MMIDVARTGTHIAAKVRRQARLGVVYVNVALNLPFWALRLWLLPGARCSERQRRQRTADMHAICSAEAWNTV
jgi:hypothetical protein